MEKQLTFSDFIYHLWTRRFVIVIVCFFTLILGYLGMRYLHGELYQTTALMIVRSQPRISIVESEEIGVQPPAFQSLFTSDETISYVRNQYNDMFERGVFPPEATHTKLQTELERLRARFNVENGTTVDTTITTKFSPILEFSVLGESRDQALVLMELWTAYCLREFGNLVNDEAEVAIQSYDLKNEQLGSELGTITVELEKLRQEKILIDTEIRGLYRTLTNMPPEEAKRFVDNDMLPFNMDTGPFRTDMNVTTNEGVPEPGIWERIRTLRLESSSESDQSQQEIVQTLNRLMEQSNEIMIEIRELIDESTELAAGIANLEVKVNSLQYAIRLNSSAYAQAQALRRPVAEGSDDPETDLAGNQQAFGTLRLISDPVLPQKRYSPQRTLIALMITIGVGLFMLLLFCVERYLRYVVDLQNEKKAKA